MGRFVEGANGGRISQGAVVVSAADIGVDEVPLGVLKGTPSAPGSQVSVVLPGGARAIKIAAPMTERTMVLVPGEALGTDSLVLSDDSPVGIDRVVDVHDLLPGRSWTATAPDDPGSPSSRWLTEGAAQEKIELAVEKVERAKAVAVATGSTPPEEAFDLAKADLPGRVPESGATFDPRSTLVALTGQALLEALPDDGAAVGWPREYDVGNGAPAPAPLGGVTFGVGVLSTPAAAVAGESLNPLAREETGVLLRREEARRMLSRAGLSDADDVEWLAGPERIEPKGPSGATLLGNGTEVESFVGVVSGEAGPWGVGVHVARVDADDDHVVVAGVHRRVVGSADAAMEGLREGVDAADARRLLVETVGHLELG